MGTMFRSEEYLAQFDGGHLPLTVVWSCFDCGNAPYLLVDKFDDGVECRCLGFVVGCGHCTAVFEGASRVEAVERWNERQSELRGDL